MRWLYDKLKAFGRWIKNKTTNNFVVRAIARAHDRSVERSARWVLPWCFNNTGRRNRFFNTRFGMRTLKVLWGAISWVGVITYPIYDVVSWVVRKVAKGGLRLLQGVAYLLAGIWAVLSIAFTVLLAAVVWVLNTLRHAMVTAWRATWHRLTRGKHAARPAPITRYAKMREVQAYYLGGLTSVHAGAARLFRRLIGDRFCWFIVKHTSDMTARLHPPTFDYWFGREMPYGYNDDLEQYALIVMDGGGESEQPVSEKDKSEAFFRNSGAVLIATAPDTAKSERDVFNEMVRERWANIDAAEISTDEWGRTWAWPRPGRPLYKDVSTGSDQPRVHADAELGWMTEQDPKARAYGYGRHWIAALLDQDPTVLSTEDRIKKERAMLHFKTRNGQVKMPIEHILRGFDQFVQEHRASAESAPV